MAQVKVKLPRGGGVKLIKFDEDSLTLQKALSEAGVTHKATVKVMGADIDGTAEVRQEAYGKFVLSDGDEVIVGNGMAGGC